MKAGWEVRPLGEVVRFDRGLTYTKSDEVTSSGNIVLRANNVSLDGGILDFTELRYISDTISIPDDKITKRDSLLICIASGSRSHLGKTALIDTDVRYAFGGFMGMITPFDLINSRYLYWLTQSSIYREHLSQITSGANINNLKFSDISTLPIPLPPFEEQRRIVAVLDEAFNSLTRARANIEANMADAEAVFDTHLTSVLTAIEEAHPARNLADLCKRITVGHVGSMTTRYQEDGIPFLRSQNVRPFAVDLTDVKYIDDAFDGELVKSRLRPGDCAIVRTGNPGTCAVIPEDLPEANCADLVIARPGPDLAPDYLALFLNSSFGKAHVGANVVGAAQKHFNVTEAKRTPLALPPLKEQHRLVDEAAKVRQTCRRTVLEYTAQLADLATLRQTLLARAFRGELT